MKLYVVFVNQLPHEMYLNSIMALEARHKLERVYQNLKENENLSKDVIDNIRVPEICIKVYDEIVN